MFRSGPHYSRPDPRPRPPPGGVVGAPAGFEGAPVGAVGPDGLAGPAGPDGAELGGTTGILGGGAAVPTDALAVAPIVNGMTSVCSTSPWPVSDCEVRIRQVS